MQIAWTNCAEQIPPDDEQVKSIVSPPYGQRCYIGNGCLLNSIVNRVANPNGYMWTPYTPEKWRYLNNENVK